MRRLFASCSVVSLLLCAALCAMWARSYGSTDQVAWTRSDGERTIRSGKGHLAVTLNLRSWSGEAGRRYGWTYSREEARNAALDASWVLFLCSDQFSRVAHWSRAGFAWSKRQSRNDLVATVVAPFWGLAAAAAVLPLSCMTVSWHGRRRARHRARSGLCRDCGYDLRATPEGGTPHGRGLLERCPECGLATHGEPSSS